MPRHGAEYWNRIVERVVNERRSYGRDHIYVGDHYERGYPLIVPRSMFERHGLFYGPPGTGKSVVAAQLALQVLAYHYNLVIIDCKGSFVVLNNVLDHLNNTRNESEELSHDVRVFNPFRGFPSHIYNPMRQKVWLDAPSHTRAETLNEAFGIRGAEGTNTAFFAAMSYLCSTDMITWFPDIASAAQFFAIINDRELFGAKGGNLNDWNHSRHLAAALRQLSECGPLNATPKGHQQEIELTELFTAEKPQFYYFFLSAVEEQRTSEAVGRLVLQQIKRAAFRCRTSKRKRKTILICDEAQQLFGPMFGDVLEQLREFGVSVLMMHQSRGQLVTPLADFRERFENAIGIQACLGVRTPDEIEYLSKSDGEKITYDMSWTQPVMSVGSQALIHPRLSYQRSYLEPQLHSVTERTVPKLDRNTIKKVSADPYGGFIRGFLNERLWAFDGSWVPFRWCHHITRDEFETFGDTYPSGLPGQDLFVPEIPQATPPNPFAGIKTDVDTDALTAALRQLSLEHRKKNDLNQERK